MATKNDKTASRKSIITEYKEFKDTKERLQRYLNALEAKRVAAQDWMEEYTEEITIGYHNLYKAITDKNAKQAKAIIEEAQKNDTAGVILTIPVDQEGTSFASWVNNTWDSAKALQETISNVQLGIPKTIFEDVNQQFGLDKNGEAPEITQTDDEPEEEVKTGFWDKVTGKDAKEEEALKQRIEDTKKELLSVQTDQPYYIDSFFDWVESGTLPEHTEKHTQNETVLTDDLMDQYQDPSYMLRLANNDLDETLMAYTERAQGLATDYNAFVNAFEGMGDASDQIKARLLLDVYTNSKETDYFDTLKSWAFRDYNVVSFADWAFRTFDDPKIQNNMLHNLSIVGEGVKFSDAKTDEEVFDKILTATLDEDKPLSYDALAYILNDIYHSTQKKPSAFSFVNGQNTVKRITDRYRADPEQNARMLSTFLAPNNPTLAEIYDVTGAFAKLLVAIDKKDAAQTLYILSENDDETREQIMGLLYTIEPNINLTDEIYTYSQDAANIRHAIKLGLPRPSDAIMTNASGAKSQYHSFAHFIQDIADTDALTAESVKSYIINDTNVNYWRDIVTQPSGSNASLLERMYTASNESSDKIYKTIIEETLSVFEGDVTKSNVLYEAAETAKDPKIKKQMIEAAEVLSGTYFTFNDTSILNLNKVANIWATDGGFGYLAAGDVQQSVEARFTKEEKIEYLKSLAHRDELIVAGEELLNPQLIDLAWADTSDENNITLNIYATGASSSITLSSADEATQVLEAIAAENDQIIEVSGNVVINKATVNHIYQQDGELNQNVIYKSAQTAAYKEDLYISTPAEDDFSEEMMTELAKDSHLEKVGNHLINLDEIAMAWYDDNNDQISFILKGQPFYANDEEMLSGIPASSQQAESFIDALKAKHATAYHEDGIFLNPDHIAYAYTAESDDEQAGNHFVVYSNGTETPLPMDTDTRQSIQNYLDSTGHFMTCENALLNLNYTSSTSPDEDGTNRFIMIDDRSFTVDNATYLKKAKKLAIGDESNNDNIELAGGQINFDLIHELHVYHNHTGEEALAYHCTTSPSMTTLNLPEESGQSTDVITQIKEYGQSLVKASNASKKDAQLYRGGLPKLSKIANDALVKAAVLQQKKVYANSISSVFAHAANQNANANTSSAAKASEKQQPTKRSLRAPSR